MKKVVRYLSLLLVVALLVSSTPVLAANYPTVEIASSSRNIVCEAGEPIYFDFIIQPVYYYEAIHISIFDAQHNEIAYLDQVFYGDSTEKFVFPVVLEDTSKYWGTFTLECYMSYYVNDQWYDAPGKQSTYFTVNNPCSAGNHAWDSGTQIVAPTCTTNGTLRYYCTKCDKFKDQSIPATGHVWDEGEVIVAPTDAEKGTMRFTCLSCYATMTKNIYCVGGDACSSDMFTDAPDLWNWAHPGVDYALTNGLFNGTSDTTFEPNSNMTRAMLVTVLYRFAGKPSVSGTASFVDIPATGWYTAPVAWAAQSGIVNGVDEQHFNPNGNVTREQMATILYRYATNNRIDTSASADLSAFPDENQVGNFAKNAMRWAVAEGLINGSDGKLLPKGNATRAQVATIMMRFVENVASKPVETPQWRAAMITDPGNIDDNSFNQATYEGGKEWCEANGMEFNYYRTTEDSTNARVAAIDKAVADGHNIIFLPGYIFADAVIEAAEAYPDVNFVCLDIVQSDLVDWDNPDAEYDLPENVTAISYKEEIAGFMAGYAAVKLGYRSLGFFGGMAIPAVDRYGYGFVQGADAAAVELGVENEVSVTHAYANQFYPDNNLVAYMNGWYQTEGIEAVFACGGGIYQSVGEAAQKKEGAKVIGVDVDQAPDIDGMFGEGLTLTSAMKGLSATVRMLLNEIILNNNWNTYGGTYQHLGMGSETPEDNFVQLAPSTQFSDTFTYEDYAALCAKLFHQEITVSDATDTKPTVSITVDYRGNIK